MVRAITTVNETPTPISGGYYVITSGGADSPPETLMFNKTLSGTEQGWTSSL